MKKRMGIFAITVLIVLGLVACSNSNVSKSEKKTVSSEYKEAKTKDKKEDNANKSTPTPTPVPTPTAPAEKPEKAAYLTFDDGPSDNTKKILDILDENNVKATFFVIYQKDYEDLYKKIVEKGHTIALHSYTHNYEKIYKSEEAYFEDLNKLSDYVKSVTGVDSKIIRFPGGSSNTVSKKSSQKIMTKLSKAVTDKGYVYFDWNVSSGDASSTKQSKDKILSNVINGVDGKDSAVILMHDAEVKTTTVEALPEIIKNLKEKGYTMLPLVKETQECHHTINN